MANPIDTAYVEIIPDLRNFMRQIATGMSQAGRAIQQNLGRSLQGAQRTFDDLGRNATQRISQIPQAFTPIAQAASRAAEGARDFFQTASGHIVTAFGVARDSVITAFEGIQRAGQRIRDALKPIWDRIGDDVTAAARAIGQTFATAAQTAGAAIIGVGVASLTAGANFNILSQSVFQSLSAILQSRDGARDLMDEIIELSMTAAFSRQAFLSSTQQLSAYGVEADRVGDVLLAMQDAAVATGGGEEAFATLTDILSQVAVQGRITGNELMRMGSLGIDAVGVIAEQSGTTVEAVRAAMDAGTIGLEELTEALATRYAGAVDNYADTWAGAQGRIGARLRNIGSDIMETFIGLEEGGAGVEGLNLIADGMTHIQNEVIPQLLPYVEMLGEWFVTAAGRIGEALASVNAEGFGRLLERLSEFGPIIAAVAAGFATMFAANLPIIGQFLSGLNPIVVGLGVLIATTPELREAFMDAFGTILDAIQPLLPLIADLVSELMTGLAPVIADLVGVIGELFATLMPVIGALLDGLAPVLPTIVSAIGTLVGAAARLIVALLPIIQAILPMLVSFLTIVINVLVKVAEFLTPVIAFVIELAAAFLEWLIPAISAIVSWLIDNFQPAFEAILTWMMPIIEVLHEIWSGLAEFFITLWEGLQDRLDDLQAVFAAIIDWMRPVIDWVTDNWNRAVDILRTLWNAVSSAAASVKDTVVSNFRAMVDFVAELPRRIANAVSGLWDGITSGLKTAINWVIDMLNSAIGALNRLIDGANNVPGVDIPNIPEIPKLATGGRLIESGLAMVGERGPELLNLPAGAEVIPLDRAYPGGFGGDGGAPNIQVFIGDRELTDLLDIRINQRNANNVRRARAGTGAL